MAKIHSIETFGAVDGPGIRFVVFMQGCPMRCLYCHNPDSWDISNGQEISIDSLLAEILKYKNYYGKEGGVTLSGGEPLLQLDFVIELFEKLKSYNINTCIDTSGIMYNTSVETDVKIDKLLSLTDLVLLDIKHIEDANHQNLTGKSNKNILNFARYLNRKNIPMWIRYVLVPGYTDNEDDIKKLRSFLDTLDNIKKIEVLPYHSMGVVKYEKLKIDYKLKDVEPPTKDSILLAQKILTGEEN